MLKYFFCLCLFVLFGGFLFVIVCIVGIGNDVVVLYIEGIDYVILFGLVQCYSVEGKVEVVEVFFYGCIYCVYFVFIVEKLCVVLFKGVVFKLVLVLFSVEWLLFVCVYYVVKKFGVVDCMYLELFKEKFEQNYLFNIFDELVDFYVCQGVNCVEFMCIVMLDVVIVQMKSDLVLIQKWGVIGMLMIVVDGKYCSGEVYMFDQFFVMIQWLVKCELVGK